MCGPKSPRHPGGMSIGQHLSFAKAKRNAIGFSTMLSSRESHAVGNKSARRVIGISRNQYKDDQR